ncbi:MAG: hypothetical protein QOJ58_5340 [Alphaproteobacteria bacterium]|jgi:hypothetical protein|nr:hypothetical protein [Alphaproteobacteria bacterium]
MGDGQAVRAYDETHCALEDCSRVVGLTVQGESLRPEISSLPFSRE